MWEGTFPRLYDDTYVRIGGDLSIFLLDKRVGNREKNGDGSNGRRRDRGNTNIYIYVCIFGRNAWRVGGRYTRAFFLYRRRYGGRVQGGGGYIGREGSYYIIKVKNKKE